MPAVLPTRKTPCSTFDVQLETTCNEWLNALRATRRNRHRIDAELGQETHETAPGMTPANRSSSEQLGAKRGLVAADGRKSSSEQQASRRSHFVRAVRRRPLHAPSFGTGWQQSPAAPSHEVAAAVARSPSRRGRRCGSDGGRSGALGGGERLRRRPLRPGKRQGEEPARGSVPWCGRPSGTWREAGAEVSCEGRGRPGEQTEERRQQRVNRAGARPGRTVPAAGCEPEGPGRRPGTCAGRDEAGGGGWRQRRPVGRYCRPPLARAGCAGIWGRFGVFAAHQPCLRGAGRRSRKVRFAAPDRWITGRGEGGRRPELGGPGWRRAGRGDGAGHGRVEDEREGGEGGHRMLLLALVLDRVLSGCRRA